MITFKRGDTLKLTGIQLLDDNDQPVLLDSIQIRSQVRTPRGKLAFEFTVTKGSFTYDLDAGDTSLCPLGDLICDVQYTFPDGEIQSTDDFRIRCEGDQTR